MIKILAMVPEVADTTSRFRAMGPLVAMEKQDQGVQISVGAPEETYYDWPAFSRHDVLFCQRPYLPIHSKIIQRAKQQRLKVWVDLDDHMLAVPEDNRNFLLYANTANRAAIIQCAQMADVVSVPTEALKTVIGEHCINVKLIPNAYDDITFGKDPERPKERKKIIAWRGGDSHQRDLFSVRDDVLRTAKENPEWKWAFMGYKPLFITDFLPENQYRAFDFTNTYEYMATIGKLGHRIQIVPLIETRFNLCKSNIAWIEASYAGAETIAPAWTEWSQPGVRPYSPEEPFYDVLQSAIRTGEDPMRDDRGWSYIRDNLFLSQVNRLRFELIRSLLI